MTELLRSFSAFTVFLGIAAMGFLFLLASFLFGEIFDHLGADAGDFDHGGPSFFSLRVLSVFVTGFGGVGAIGIHFGLTVLPASGLGFLSGMTCALIIYSFARFLYGQQASTQYQSGDLVGKTGRTVVGIPKGGMGQIRCQIGEELVDKMARSQDGAAIGENSIVQVVQVLGEIVIVRPQ